MKKMLVCLTASLAVILFFVNTVSAQTTIPQNQVSDLFKTVSEKGKKEVFLPGVRAPRVCTVPVMIEIPGTGTMQCTGVVKVWAVRADESGREYGGPVSINRTPWKKKERFYLHFETATPIIVSLYQLYPETGHPGQFADSKVVLPDDKFPTSYDAIPPGNDVRLPILLEMDNTLVDEDISIAVTPVDFEPGKYPPLPPDLGMGNNHFISQTESEFVSDGVGATFSLRGHKSETNQYFDQLGKNVLTKKKEMPSGARVIAAAGIEPAGPASSQNYDDIAATFFIKGAVGFIKLTMHKR
ncbi:MAG: hypothetical protein LBC20_07450 [Planctomycetaceae bacterium]|jgi:hypothetical protein|nr:hypothetical protein [Planctomycetaceae bacterium]